MTARKQAEAEFASMMASYHIWCHKWQDMMYCPNCHAPIHMTKRTDGGDPREVKESIVDYEIIVGSTPAWVECKQETESFPLGDREHGIDPKQRQFLNSWQKRGVNCWLFLLLGDGTVTRGGRQAYLLHWAYWTEKEKQWLSAGLKSLPFKTNRLRSSWIYNASVQLASSVLVWEKGWRIPPDHLFATYYPYLYTLAPLFD